MASKPVLALLPGLLCDAALWRHQVSALADVAECRVADLSPHVSMAEIATAALEQLPDRFALAALSMGGYVAFEMLRQAPERVSRLALLDTKVRPDTPEQKARRRDLLQLAAQGKFKGVTPRLLPLLIHEGRLGEPELTGEILAMADRIGKEAFVRHQSAILNRPDYRPVLVTISCPTLVLCGRQDALTPVGCHTEMAAGIAGARHKVIEDCGHLSPLERPAEVTAALRDWLLQD